MALLVASALSLSLLAPVGAVADEPVGVPELLTPVNLSSSTELPTFTWSAVTDARSCKFQMSTTADFASRFYETTIAGRSLTLPQNKGTGRQYDVLLARRGEPAGRYAHRPPQRQQFSTE